MDTVAHKIAVKQAHPIRWLGVCGVLSEMSGLDLWVVRAVFVIGGVFFAPVALSIYAIIYFYLRLFHKSTHVPPFHPWPFIKLVAGTILVLIALAMTAHYAVAGIVHLFRRFTDIPPDTLARFMWLTTKHGQIQFWTVMFAMPLVVLGGLPLAHRWNYTLKTIGHALIALYAVFIAAGIGAVLTGVIVALVGRYAS